MGAIILTANQVRAKIAEVLRDTIGEHRSALAQGDPNYTPPVGDVTEDEVDQFIAAHPDLRFDYANMLGPLDRSENFAVRVRSESVDEFDDALTARVRMLSGGRTDEQEEEETEEHYEAPDGFEPAEQRLWLPHDERPPWIDTSRSALLLARQLIEEGRLLSELDWREFEKLIGELLEKDGWNVQVMRGTKDGGIDVISTRVDPAVGALRAIWQAKRYGEGRKVQLSHARELSGVIERERASKGVLITTTSLTRGALDWVKQDEFRLSAKDGGAVRRWIERYTG